MINMTEKKISSEIPHGPLRTHVALAAMLLLAAPFLFSSCAKKFDPLFNLYTNDSFEQPAPDGTVLIFKDTNKFDYTVTVNLAEAARLNDHLTTGTGATLLMRRPDWQAEEPIPASFRNEFMALADRWTFKFLVADKPTSLTLVAEDHFLPALRDLRPTYELRWRITRFRKGNGFLRYFLGYGISPVKAHLEGEILTPGNGKLARFKLICEEAGLTMGGWNFKVASWKYCATILTVVIGKGLSEAVMAGVGEPYQVYQIFALPPEAIDAPP